MNVTAVVDTSGAVVERYAYDPYGQVTILNGADGADPDVDGETVFEWGPDADGASDVDNRTLYAGYHLDAETGLYSVRNRYYHPTLGRWLSRDPVGYVDGMNLYQYVLCNPIAFGDPLGLMSATELVARLSINTTLWKSMDGKREVVFALTAVPVEGCPADCPCADITATLSYSRLIDKGNFDLNQALPIGTMSFVVVGGPGFDVGEMPPDPSGGVLTLLFGVVGSVVRSGIKEAQNLVNRGAGLLEGKIRIGDLIQNENIAGSITGSGRVCAVQDKLVADVCAFTGTFSYNIGSTKRNPLPGVGFDMGFSATVNLDYNACEGTLGVNSKGVVNVSVSLPGDTFNVTGDMFTVWNWQSPIVRDDKLKLWEHGDLPNCGE